MSTAAVAATATGITIRDGMKGNVAAACGGDDELKKNVDHDVDDNGLLNNGCCKSKTTVEVKEDLLNSNTEESEPGAAAGLSLSLKEQLNLGKDDESSPRKSSNEEVTVEVANESAIKGGDNIKVENKEDGPAELQVLNLTVESPGRPDNVVPIPFRPSTSKATLFTLKEGSKYRIIFNFMVSKNTVSGLKYIGDVWKKGIKVDHSKKPIIGSSVTPRDEAYVFELENGTTPSGMFARGSYSARARFVDGDGKCYLDTTYYFDIQKNWAS